MTEETFVSPEEYPTYFTKLNGLRRRIVEKLPMEPRMRILDIATGSAYFALELGARDPTLKITGIDISEQSVKNAWENIRNKWLDSTVSVYRMDSARLEFPSSHFSLATNFLGLEDIHMTRGVQGIRETFHEVGRVLKPRGYFCFTVMPPEEAETAAQRLECDVFSYICGATWLPAIKYQEFLRGAGFTLLKREILYTGKKLTTAQAREEIEFACENVPKIYNVESKKVEEVWDKFGPEIEINGLGHYSRVVLMIARKNS